MQPSHIFSHCSEILLSFLLILAILMDPRTMRYQSSDLTDLHWWKKRMTRMLWRKILCWISLLYHDVASLIGNDTQNTTSSLKIFAWCEMPSCKIHCMIFCCQLVHFWKQLQAGIWHLLFKNGISTRDRCCLNSSLIKCIIILLHATIQYFYGSLSFVPFNIQKGPFMPPDILSFIRIVSRC